MNFRWCHDKKSIFQNLFFEEDFKVHLRGGVRVFSHGFNGSRMMIFFRDFLKKVVMSYYGENEFFLRMDVSILKLTFFSDYFLKKVVMMYYGENEQILRMDVSILKLTFFLTFF